MLNISRFRELRFLELTLFLVFFWLLLPLIGDHRVVHILTQLFLLNSLIVALSTSEKRSIMKRVVWVFWFLAVATSLISLFPVKPDLKSITTQAGELFNFAVLLLSIVSILTVVFRSNRITVDTIFAALVAYLLIAFAFGILYKMMVLGSPASFKGLTGDPQNSNEMIYFSVITLATLGYGDIVPVANTARTIAGLEAIVGQFYVAVIISVLVGIFISQRIESNKQEREDK